MEHHMNGMELHIAGKEMERQLLETKFSKEELNRILKKASPECENIMDKQAGDLCATLILTGEIAK